MNKKCEYCNTSIGFLAKLICQNQHATLHCQACLKIPCKLCINTKCSVCLQNISINNMAESKHAICTKCNSQNTRITRSMILDPMKMSKPCELCHLNTANSSCTKHTICNKCFKY